MSSWHYYPKEFSSNEEYEKYLKEKGFAIEVPEGMYKTSYINDMCIHCSTDFTCDLGYTDCDGTGCCDYECCDNEVK